MLCFLLQTLNLSNIDGLVEGVLGRCQLNSAKGLLL
jgi:hypothetical protein